MVYSYKELVDPMVIVCKKYSKVIITMDSAFYYYNLTDVIPQTTHIATGMHSYGIPNNNIKQYFINEELLEIGKTVGYINNEIIN